MPSGSPIELDLTEGCGLESPCGITWDHTLTTPIIMAAEWLAANPGAMPEDLAAGIQRVADVFRKPPEIG